MAKQGVIKIESILGGQSPSDFFAAPNQFRASRAINPGWPADDNNNIPFLSSSGLLRPTTVSTLGTTFSVPNWIIPNPKDRLFYVYDAGGSVYSYKPFFPTAYTLLGDLNDGGTSSGNGGAYYDNYVYFARDTTIARYGPLDGTAAFTDDYWVSTLGKTALTNTIYPKPSATNISTARPNHVMHRHSDGKLYFGDVVGNKGTLHYISTTKTTVEGDTDNGSTYQALQFGYGLWPTALETYGSSLVIALSEVYGNSNGSQAKSNAKIGFWDTTSQNVNQIIWVEFPDTIISCLKNVGGVLYAVSGAFNAGFRVSRYIGGYTFQDVVYNQDSIVPFAGAVDGADEMLLVGGTTGMIDGAGTPHRGGVWSVGLQQRGLSKDGLFNVMSSADASTVTALSIALNTSLGFVSPIIGWAGKSGVQNEGGIDIADTADYSLSPALWWSQTYRIGQPFKITKIRIPLATPVTANTVVTPKIYVDDDQPSYSPYTLQVINWTNFPNEQYILIQPTGLTGKYDFWLELGWSGVDLCTVSLPITIEYEIIDD